MLEFIREKAKGIVAWAILILIAVPFALWGINNYFTGPTIVTVAEVNGLKITADEFARAYREARQALQAELGDAYEAQLDEKTLRREVMDQLIDIKVIESWIQSQGMAIGDAHLAMKIQSLPFFLDEKGQFDQKKYEEILRRNGLTPARFEQLQRMSMLQEQFMALTEASSWATRQEVDQLLALQQQERRVGWLQFDLKPYLAQVQVSEADARAYYEAHKADFVEPEKIVVEYVLLDKTRLAQRIQPDEATLKQYYEDNRDLFAEAEQRRARHILVEVRPDDPESEKQAQARLKEIQSALAAGKDFAELAKQYSDDPGSAEMGGDLGWFESGMMVPEFDAKVFSMKKGEVSEPVKTQFGYHIIQLEDIRPRRVPDFASVKDQVLAHYRQQEVDKQYFDLMEKMNTAAYEQPDTLAPAAEAIGGEVTVSEPFSVDAPRGLFATPKVQQALKSDEVLKQRLNSEVIELGPDQAIVVRVKEIIPSRQLAFDEVKDRIIDRLKRDEARSRAEAEADRLLEALRKGEAVEKLTTPEMTWHAPVWTGRQSLALPPPVLQAAFEMPRPKSDGTPVWKKVILPDGAPALIVVEAVRTGQGSNEAAAEMMRLQLKTIMTEMMADAEVISRVAELRQRADIDVNEEAYMNLAVQ